ncbi:MAG: hypothetical protein QM529_04390 [Hydrotalea sp.]|nr:hypothetical protein [Hydrotalea sp.]
MKNIKQLFTNMVAAPINHLKKIIFSPVVDKIAHYIWVAFERVVFHPLEKYLGLVLEQVAKQVISFCGLFFILWLLLHNHWPFSWLMDMMLRVFIDLAKWIIAAVWGGLWHLLTGGLAAICGVVWGMVQAVVWQN